MAKLTILEALQLSLNATKKYVDDNDMRMLEYVYNGKVFKITLTAEQEERLWSLQSGEYIVLDSILPEDIYKCTDTGSIWYGCILINNILFKVNSVGSLKINTIKSNNAIHFYTETAYYNSSTQAEIFRYNWSLAVLNDTEEVVLVKCNDINYCYTSTEYVDEKVAGLVDSAPEALNTLNELATALGNDANFATTISNQIGLKANSSDLATVATSGDYNDLNNKPSIPTVTNDLTNELKANYDAAYTHSTSAHAPSNAQANADITKAEIEAKLTGDITSHTHSQYLTSVPAEYITETELTDKGYAPLDSPNFTNSISMGRKEDTTIGVQSVALGNNTIASGNYSHAEGNSTEASGLYSYAEGCDTKASSSYQHVQGKYNIEDTENKYAHIVGNGESQYARSNAHTLDWQGNGWYKGKLSQDGTPTEDKDLTTKKYVDDAIENIQTSGGSNINDTTASATTTYSSNKIENIKEDLSSQISAIGGSGDSSGGMTSEQTQQLSAAYEHSQSTHAPSDAEANVQVDWNETDMTSDSYIKNKPTNLATMDDIPTVPTKTSQLINDSNFVTDSVVDEKISNAQLSDKYVTKETGNANQITFADGQTFQAKLDAGILKGDKGDTGAQGPQGIQGQKGDKGDPGVNNINDTTASANTTYSGNKIESIKENLNSQINAIANNFTTEQNDSSFIIKYGNKVIAEIPLNVTPTVYGNIIVDATNLEITEGDTSTFTVHLDQAPTKNQVINIASDNSKVAVNPSTLTFTPSNYNTTQTVTISTEDDAIEDNGYTLTLTLSSNNVDNVAINVTVKDNDIAINWHTVTTSDVTISPVVGVNCITAINTTEQYLDFPSDLPCFRLSKACDTVKGIKFNEGSKAEWESAAYFLQDRLPNVEIVTGGGINIYGRTGNPNTIMPFMFNGKDTNIKEFTFYPIGLTKMDNMFKGMTKLAKVFIVPSTVTSWNFAFNNCVNLHNVSVDNNTLSLKTSFPAFEGVPACRIKCNDESTIHSEIIERAGTPQVTTRNIPNVQYFDSLNGTSPKNINCFGDSLTHAINNITPYPKYLQGMLDSSQLLVYNVSQVGFTSQQIKENFIDVCYPCVKDIAVIWSGSNDENKTATKEQLVSNIQSLVDSLPPGIDYVVVGLITYQWTQEVDDSFEAAFGDKFLNMHDYLCSNKAFTDIGETPTADDTTAISNGNLPPSLINNYHQTELGSKATAFAIKEKLLSLGYITSSQVL